MSLRLSLVSDWSVLEDHLSSLVKRATGHSPGVVCLGSLSFIIRRSFVSSNNITLVEFLYSYSFEINTSSFIIFSGCFQKVLPQTVLQADKKHDCNVCLFPQSDWSSLSILASDWLTLGLVTKHGLWWHIHRPGINLADLWKIFPEHTQKREERGSRVSPGDIYISVNYCKYKRPKSNFSKSIIFIGS